MTQIPIATQNGVHDDEIGGGVGEEGDDDEEEEEETEAPLDFSTASSTPTPVTPAPALTAVTQPTPLPIANGGGEQTAPLDLAAVASLPAANSPSGNQGQIVDESSDDEERLMIQE